LSEIALKYKGIEHYDYLPGGTQAQGA
jgi:hypothetical protein